MKKGSRLKHCSKCGRAIFWEIPESSILGLQLVTRKDVIPWGYLRIDNWTSKYVCKDCLEKES